MADGDMTEAAMKILLEKLIEVASGQIKLVRGFGSELEKLKESFEKVQAFSGDAARRQVEDESVKLWLNKLEDAAYEADNLLDGFDLEMRRREVHKTKQKVCFFFFSFFKDWAFRRGMAIKLKYVNMKLEELNNEANGTLQCRVVNSELALPNVKETDSVTIDPIFIGRQTNLSYMVNMLLIPSEEVISIIPIVGMGGLGKTALARSVYKNPEIQKQFNEKIWICVSENFDTLKLLRRILDSLRRVVGVRNRELIVQELGGILGKGRYLLVLDDLRNKNAGDWDDFKRCLSGINPNKGNFILVTTRDADVASMVNPSFKYPLEKLSDDACWSIIKARAFRNGGVPQELETIGKQVARRCGGLPLAAGVVGGTLEGKEKHDWTSFLSIGFSDSNGEENSVLQVLKVGFDRLPSLILKRCFSYCSLFMKDEIIHRERLIQLWMAEGFLLDQEDGNDAESVGNRVFNILLKTSFLHEPVNDKYGNIKYCTMHDLMHDLASSVSKAGSFNVEKESAASDNTPRLRYLATNSLDEEAYMITKEKSGYLRTLFLRSCEVVNNNIFDNIKHLRTLVLEESNIKELASSIGKLKHLRLLDVSETDITVLPKSICKLLHLQTLRAIRCRLDELPDDLCMLVSLRHLVLTAWRSEGINMPLGIGKLTSLRTLTFFNLGVEEGRRIQELGCLKHLKGKLCIRNLDLVKDREEATGAKLSEKPDMQKLKLSWSPSREGENNDEEVLEGLHPHQNIKCLIIENFLGDHFPEWTMKMKISNNVILSNLIEIRLSECRRCQEIPTLGHLPLLEHLELKRFDNVTSVQPSFYDHPDSDDEWTSSDRGDGTPPAKLFPALKTLELRYMPNLLEWFDANNNKIALQATSAATSWKNVTVFPSLEHLVIDSCPKFTGAPSQYASLKTFSIYNVPNLKCLPEAFFYNNRRLTSVDIFGCDELTHFELPVDAPAMQSLEILHIGCCRKLTSISFSFHGKSSSPQGLTSLRELEIGNCSELVSLPIEMLESIGATSLERLQIEGTPKFRSEPKGIGRLFSLTDLSIGPFWNMELLDNWVGEIQPLQQQQHSLRSLTLCGLREWDSLPLHLRFLTSLVQLELSDFGIKALEEWITELSSLQYIKLENLENLRHLPSKEDMRRLPKLQKLYIWGCPLLCLDKYDVDSEWPKISHLREINLRI